MKTLKRAWGRLVCRVRGHDFPCLVFTANTLCFCRRCGKEVADRSFAHLTPMSEEEREELERWDEALPD